jgi:hypothetical protein
MIEGITAVVLSLLRTLVRKNSLGHINIFKRILIFLSEFEVSVQPIFEF